MNNKVLTTRALLDSFKEKMGSTKKPLKEGLEEAPHSVHAPAKPIDNWNEAMWTEKRKQFFDILKEYCAQLISDLGIEGDEEAQLAVSETVADIRLCKTYDELSQIMDYQGYPAGSDDLIRALLGE